MTTERVGKLIADIRHLREERYSLVQEVRNLVLSAGADVSEEVKYGGILFSADSAFSGVFSYAHHVSLVLSEGAKLSDPHGVLEGGGKHRRHIKLRAPADIADKHVREYIGAAHKAAVRGE